MALTPMVGLFCIVPVNVVILEMCKYLVNTCKASPMTQDTAHKVTSLHLAANIGHLGAGQVFLLCERLHTRCGGQVQQITTALCMSGWPCSNREVPGAGTEL